MVSEDTEEEYFREFIYFAGTSSGGGLRDAFDISDKLEKGEKSVRGMRKGWQGARKWAGKFGPARELRRWWAG